MRIPMTFRSTNQRMSVKFKSSDTRLKADFGAVLVVPEKVDVETFKGPYEITPAVDAQIAHTARKLMSQDMTIKAIPFYDTSNAAGGTTIFIGNEV